MKDLFLILVSAAFVNNLVLERVLGVCPGLAASRRMDTALGLAAVSLFVLTLSSALGYVLYHDVLVPLGLAYLQLMVFLLLVVGIVRFAEDQLREASPRLHGLFGPFLPLATSNCAVLGVALLSTTVASSFLDAIVFGIGTALGAGLVMLMLAGLRERLEGAAVPAPFRGAPIALLTLGVLAIGFMGFAGIARG